MSAFQTQLAAGIAQAMNQTGEMLTYTPAGGDAPFQVLVMVENRGFLVDNDSMMLLAADHIDVLILAASLNRTPAVGDQIAWTCNGKTLTLSAMIMDGRLNVWEWQDRYQIRYRIHMKVIAVN